MKEKIEAIYNVVLSNSFLKALIWFLVALYLITFYQREIKGDDCWFGEQAYWLAMEESVKLESIPVIFNWDTQFLVYHKLLIWMGSLVVTLFGWSVDYFRCLNLLFFIGVIVVICKYLKSSNSQQVLYLTIFLFLCTPIAVSKSFEFRPEVPALFFGLTSFFMLHKYCRSGKMMYVLIAGIAAGLGFLSHLNGVIYCVAGFILLVVIKHFKPLVIFSLIAASVCFIYFIPLLDPEKFNQWSYNLSHWPLHRFDENLDNFFIYFFNKLLSEQKRYFWDESMIMTTTLLLLSVGVRGKYIWNTQRHLMIYTGVLMLGLAIFGSHKSPRYLLLILPFYFIIIAFVLGGIKPFFNWSKIVILLILVTQFVLTIRYSYEIVKGNGPWLKRHESMLSHIPEKSNVLAPWKVIYNEIDDYNIYNYKTYLYIQDLANKSLSQHDVLKKASELNMDYILINEDIAYDKRLWFYEWKIRRNRYYQEFYKGDNFLILKQK